MNASSSSGHESAHEPDMIDPTSVAIVGMAGRFPGASNVAEFWRNVREGRETISFFTPKELSAAGVSSADINDPDYVPAKGLLQDAESFDAGFFGYTPREAELMDPQHRVFLESAWCALEDAGYDPSTYPGLIGVFAGSSMNTYLLSILKSGALEVTGGLELNIASNKDFLTTRVSYKLDLKGPSIVVQTACSTSLVAVCEACQSLLDFRCDMALAGGVTVGAPRVSGYRYVQGGISSPDGHCRPFDAGAQGTVAGEGVGIVVLKRLEDAIADGDTIRAVIKGVAVNNDGAHKVGYTAPSVVGQADAIAAAHAMADVDPATISLLEAHGTGTALGDPIEVAALNRAFALPPETKATCALGSVKSNIGHIDAAAGVAGLMKAVLALEHREIPPSLHFKRANPELGIEDGPFYVNAALAPWPATSSPRRAGVSSFGIGGTNAHVVLEEAPLTRECPASTHPQLLTLSARSAHALDRATSELATALREQDDLSLADVAYTRLAGRRRFAHRRFAVCRDRDDAIAMLEEPGGGRVRTVQREASSRTLVFMFPGQGAQRAGMGRTLHAERRRYRDVLDECAERLQPELGLDLRDLLFAEDGDAALVRTEVTQPALFVTEYALALQLIDFGIEPRALIGHSIGEYVAACLAGVMSLPDALAVVAARGRLMQSAPAGAMLAVSMAPVALAELLPASVSIAAINAPDQCVASGPVESVETLRALLDDRQITHQRLATSHAFHSETMEPVLEEFRAAVGAVTLAPPRIPLLSNLTGTWLEAAQATDPGYWVSHLRETVRFADGIDRALGDGHTTFLEVGPGETLSRLASAGESWSAEHAAIPTLGRRDDAHEALLTSVGALWADGLDIDAGALHDGERRRRVSLPGYPFERERYWLEPSGTPRKRAGSRRKIDDVGQWLYLPDWSRRPIVRAHVESGSCWLVVDDGAAIVQRTVAQARERGAIVEVLTSGADAAPDVIGAVSRLREAGGPPDVIVDPRGVGTDVHREDGWVDEDALSRWLSLVNAAGEDSTRTAARVVFLTTRTQDVVSGDRPHPGASVINGLAAVAGHEHPGLTVHCIDLDDATLATESVAVLDSLVADMGQGTDSAVAYRGGDRWVQAFDRLSVGTPDSIDLPLRDQGVYLITGGLGKIGLALAEDLAGRVAARLALLTRRTLPPCDEWDAVTDADLVATIHALRRIEEAGAEIEVVTADAADAGQLSAALAAVESRFGRIDGVVHAAGITSGATFGPMSDLPIESYREQLAAKAGGALTLAAALDSRDVDFCVLMSSLSSAIGAQGFAAYACANAFLDALAVSRDRTDGTRWLAIGFDGWRFDEGEAVSALAAVAMRPSEGVDAFYRALSVPMVPRILACTTDLDSRRLATEPQSSEAPVAHAAPAGEATVAADGEGPRGATEEAIAAVWRTMFGLEGIGRDDDFFELGGHSLLALRIGARLSKELEVSINAGMVMEHCTVARLAGAVDELLDGREQDETEALLDMVENLSEEEAAELLGSGLDKGNRRA